MSSNVVNRDQAEQIAWQFVRAIRTGDEPDRLTLIHRLTREEDFGWVFFWNDRRYVETGNGLYALCGNSPFVVLRKTGKAQYLPLLPLPPAQDQESRLQWFVANKSIDARIKAFAATLEAS